MSLSPIPLFGLGNAGRSVNVNAQQRTNLYCQIERDQEKNVVTMYPTPGLTTFVNFGANPDRAFYTKGDFQYHVNSSGFYSVANDGTTVLLGSLLTSGGRCDVIDNGFQIIVVDGTYGYIYSLLGVVAIASITRNLQTATLTTATDNGLSTGMQVTISGATPSYYNGTFTVTQVSATQFTFTLPADVIPAISSITRVGTLATLTTASAHGLQSGNTVTISGALPAQYNGTYAITVTGPTTFTYVMASDPGASAAPAGAYVIVTQPATVVGSYAIASAFTRILDPDFPGAQTVTFLNGYFAIQVPSSGKWYISGLYDGASWNALDFATAESDPDNLVRIMAENGQIVLFGEKTTEFWGDSGGVDFPFARIGASAIEWGLAARWSLCKFLDSLMFLRRNRLGYTEVCMLSGYTAKSVTPPELAFVFSQYSSVENASAFSYMVAGHAMYQINFPTPNESWLFDAQSQAWSKVQSGDGRHRGEIQASYLNLPYVSDYENGKIYRLDENVYTDDGAPIVREFISRHQSTGDYTHFPQFWLEMEAGVGLISGQGSDPMMMMSISRDGGHTYGGEVSRPIGKIGEYRRRAVFNRVGRARDWLYKFRIVEPIKTVFVAAWGRVTK